MKNLIIVESPAKAKTIKAFLGNDYEVIASKGHIRDLPKNAAKGGSGGLGIEIKNGQFIPKYEVSKDHEAVVKEIQKLAKGAKQIYIATDEDREGEAIGYHIAEAIGKDPIKLPRIVFHEITKTAIESALKSPRKIDLDRVNAQQARRLLDRIVGYKLSPLVSTKIAKGLSAGRVQSAALKIIVDREREIAKFIPQKYYAFEVIFKKDLTAELSSFKDKKLQKLSIAEQNEAQAIIKALKNAEFTIENIEEKPKKQSPNPPFMTSTLQAAASSTLGFSPTRTMKAAQNLYEGVATPLGQLGAITYMRTDSLNIAKEAQNAAREHIAKVYGSEFIPSKPKIYTTKNKGAQEAHEAIRPTMIDFTPQIAAQYLSGDILKLYSLIYNRFIASQMSDAEFLAQSVDIKGNSKDGNLALHLSGRRLTFAGFYKVLGDNDKDKILPPLKKGQTLELQKAQEQEKHTEPPAHFSEASLIKELESLGIGRPSTYAPTIALLNERKYVNIQGRQISLPEPFDSQESDNAIQTLEKTNAAKVVSLLEKNFKNIVDSGFTANMETKLDEIAEAKRDWQEVLSDFYEPFMEQIEQGKQIKSQKVALKTGEFCPQCGGELVQRAGKYGLFVGCGNYPKCKYIKKEEQEQSEEDFGTCEKCGRAMVKKRGARGEFLACSGYPECKNAKPLNGANTKQSTELNGVVCPKCGGAIVERFSRRGKFWGCKNYPKCDFTANAEPTNHKCECGGMMVIKHLKKGDTLECLLCKNKKILEE